MAEEKKIPKHLAIIMDGNGRWAKARGLTRSEGHKAGLKAARNLVPLILERGVDVVSVYAFSTENWQRKDEEVDFLFALFGEAIEEALPELVEKNIRIKFIGDRAGLPEAYQYVVPLMEQIEKESSQNTSGTFAIAVNYGGRHDIVQMVQKVVDQGIKHITEEVVSANLSTAGLPDVDLIIRASGEYRTSNLFLWEAHYAELCFACEYDAPVMWPEMEIEHIDKALEVFANRKRRFGGYDRAAI